MHKHKTNSVFHNSFRFVYINNQDCREFFLHSEAARSLVIKKKNPQCILFDTFVIWHIYWNNIFLCLIFLRKKHHCIEPGQGDS